MESAKNIIRSRMKKITEDYVISLNEGQVKKSTQGICENILTFLPQEPSLTVIAGYWPLPFEPNIALLLDALARQGHKILLPITQREGSPLLFGSWRPKDKLYKSVFGTYEPSLQKTCPDLPQIILIPMLAFDGRGNRLGYGKGHYDRTLGALRKKNASFSTVGVAFDVQRVNELPMNGHDQPLDHIVTEKKIYQFI